MHHVRLFLLYLPITVLLPATLTVYVGHRLLRACANKKLRLLLWAVAGFPAGLSASLALMFWADQDRAPIDWFLEPGFFFLGYLLTVFPLLLTVELGRVVGTVVARSGKASRNVTATSKPKPAPSTYAYWAAASLALGLVLWGRQVASDPPQVTTLSLPIQHLAAPFEGYRILQLSDIHLRNRRQTYVLDALVARANALKPDLIALTGDIVDGPMDNLRTTLTALGRLQARDGVWVVLGNHEYYADAEACITEFERLNLIVLLDEHRLISRAGASLTVAGVTNPQQGMHGSKWTSPKGRLAHCNADPAMALRGAPVGSTTLLLAHQPASVTQARDLGVDLALAGHTHGGGFFPWTLLTKHLKRYRSGLYREGNTWVFVSRGLGTFGPKMRLGAAPEMTLITLSTAR